MKKQNKKKTEETEETEEIEDVPKNLGKMLLKDKQKESMSELIMVSCA